MFTVARPAGGVSCVKLAARQATAESRTTLGLSQPPGARTRALEDQDGAVSTFPCNRVRSTARNARASLSCS